MDVAKPMHQVCYICDKKLSRYYGRICYMCDKAFCDSCGTQDIGDVSKWCMQNGYDLSEPLCSICFSEMKDVMGRD